MIKHIVRVVHSAIREATKGRSPQWREVERCHLKIQPTCAACGGSVRLQVHHIKPFHLDPQLELDPTNLITLCMGEDECHVRIGHGDSFRFYNPNVRSDAARCLMRPMDRPMVEEAAKNTRLIN